MTKKLLLVAPAFLLVSLFTSAQEIVNVNPDQGEKGNSLEVTVSGQNTNFGSASRTEIVFTQGSNTQNRFLLQGSTILSSNQIRGMVNLHSLLDTGSYDVILRKDYQEVARKTDAFRVLPDPNPPKITEIDPNKAQAGESLNVSLSGKNTDFDQGTSTEVFLVNDNNQYSTQNTIASSATEATASMDLPTTLQAGFYDFGFYNYETGNASIKEDGFFVEKSGTTAPEIQTHDQDTMVLNQTHEFEVSFTSGDLFDMSNSSEVLLTNGNAQIEADQVAILDQNTIEPTMDVPFNAQTGLYDLVVKYGGEFELTAEDAVYVKDENSGIFRAGKISETQLNIYPNPVKDDLNFKLQAPHPMKLKAEILNTNGQVVKNLFDQKVSKGEQEFEDINVDGDLPSGTYLLKISSEKGNYSDVIRFQKQ